MREILEEYGSMTIGAVAAFLLLALYSHLFLGEEGLVTQLLIRWGGLW